MKALEIQAVRQAIGAPGGGEGLVTAVSTDTRALPRGSLFVALKGERFDGHRFVAQALESGAAWAVVSEDGDYPADRILRVEDTRQAYLRLANLYRRELGLRVVAVTGSVGKTTTKEMVACALSAGLDTLKTEANLNNEVGVAQTILRLEEHHRAVVLEFGMDGPGQIAPLSLCAQPDVAVVTNIGVSHLEAMGTRENILKEKMAVTAGMAEGSPVLLCGDNDLLRGVEDPRFRIILYGIDNEACAIRAEGVREEDGRTHFVVRWQEQQFPATIPCVGRHNINNALAAFGAAVCLKIPPEQALKALEQYEPTGMRQKIVKLSRFTVVEDCYNASPDSMRAALTTLGGMACNGKRIAVLSDMLELGPIAAQAHRDVGRMAAEQGVDRLVCTGELAAEYVRGAREAGLENPLHFPDQESLFRWLRENISTGDLVWFKASRGMRLERVIERIYEEMTE